MNLGSLTKAFAYAACSRRAAIARERHREVAIMAEKLARAAAQEAQWRAELQRREEAALDADGSRAAARAAREERLEEERLAFLSAQLARRA